MNFPALAIGILIMLVGTVFPPLMTDLDGRANHWLALALFWSMSAGFIRGVGFIPHASVLRWFYSGWSCLLGLLLAIALWAQTRL